MALQIFGSNSIGSGLRADLTTADSVFVAAGVTVGSTNGTAITGTGSSHIVNIQGTVLGNFVSSTPGLQWVPTGMGYQFYFGGTSLLILVGVAMDTVAQIEAQLVMRNYEGFLGSGGRLRGRRA